jgi:hypothetical protein
MRNQYTLKDRLKYYLLVIIAGLLIGFINWLAENIA